MIRIREDSMSINGTGLANKLGYYLLDHMRGPDFMREVYEEIYLLTDDGNIYQLTRGGSLAGLGNNLVITNYMTGETTGLSMSALDTTVRVGHSFRYFSSRDKGGETPIITEIIGVVNYYRPKEDLKDLKPSDLRDRCNKLYRSQPLEKNG